MRDLTKIIVVVVCILVTGCAQLEFPKEDGGLAYFEPIPYLLVTTTAECVTTGTVVMVPGERKIVKLKSGYGSPELSITLTNGMITSVGQKTDTKIPETITAAAAFTTAILAKGKATECKPSATLYPIRNGAVDKNAGTVFPVEQLGPTKPAKPK